MLCLHVSTSSARINTVGTRFMGYSVHPNQELLEGALSDTLSEEKYAEGVTTIRDAAGVNGTDKTLDEFNLNVIIAPKKWQDSYRRCCRWLSG